MNGAGRREGPDDLNWVVRNTKSRTPQWVSESVNQWVSESVSQWVSESVSQYVSESVSQWVSERKDDLHIFSSLRLRPDLKRFRFFSENVSIFFQSVSGVFRNDSGKKGETFSGKKRNLLSFKVCALSIAMIFLHFPV